VCVTIPLVRRGHCSYSRAAACFNDVPASVVIPAGAIGPRNHSPRRDYTVGLICQVCCQPSSAPSRTQPKPLSCSIAVDIHLRRTPLCATISPMSHRQPEAPRRVKAVHALGENQEPSGHGELLVGVTPSRRLRTLLWLDRLRAQFLVRTTHRSSLQPSHHVDRFGFESGIVGRADGASTLNHRGERGGATSGDLRVDQRRWVVDH
jgi:hypothetical protein